MTLQERRRYASEMRDMAFHLLATADEMDASDRMSVIDSVETKVQTDALIFMARMLYRERAARSHFFDPALFGEPAWDLLLDIYEKDQCGKEVSVSNACIAANVPNTTALRWIAVLENEGYLERSPSPSDLRVKNLRLTSSARSAMSACLTQLYLQRVLPETKTSNSDQVCGCRDKRNAANL